MKKIDWQTSESHVFFNPRLPEKIIQDLNKLPLLDLKGHIFIASSGTTSGENSLKWIALSKQAFLASAAAVNDFLITTPQDCWINPLPEFHVGGLSIFARAHLNGAKVCALESKWHPGQFCRFIEENKGTIASLVPTQVYDLVQAKLKAPSTIRAIIVGGGSLSPALYQKGRELGWPLLPTYGLTECASQVATAKQEGMDLYLLPHVQVETTPDGRLKIKSEALLTGYVTFIEEHPLWHDPKIDGWLVTEDIVEITEKGFRPLGRADDIVKICGEKVSMKKLEDTLIAVCLDLNIPLEATLQALPDERLEYAIHLFLHKDLASHSSLITETFQTRALPFEKIRFVHFVDCLPKTALGKIRKKEISF